MVVLLFVLLFLWNSLLCSAETENIVMNSHATLLVPGSECPLCVTVEKPEGVLYKENSRWILREVNEPEEKEPQDIPVMWVPSQKEDGTIKDVTGSVMVVIPSQGKNQLVKMRRFSLIELSGADSEDGLRNVAPAFSVYDDGKASLECLERGKKILTYNYDVITHPEVPDYRRSRAAYIHPLRGLDEEVLTEDFPADHYHHHGVFWGWPHVITGGEHYDNWLCSNLTQRYEKFIHRQSQNMLMLGVENSWIAPDMKKEESVSNRVHEEKIMTERVWLQVYPTQDNERCVDLKFFWIPEKAPVTLCGAHMKSYGGLAIRFRAPEHPEITTPRGLASKDLPVFPSAWVDYTSRFKGKTAPVSGASLFIPESHPKMPDGTWPPTWLIRHYGAQCVGWPGVQGQTFPAEKPIHVCYRIWIHRGRYSVKELGQKYEEYQKGLHAHWE